MVAGRDARGLGVLVPEEGLGNTSDSARRSVTWARETQQSEEEFRGGRQAC